MLDFLSSDVGRLSPPEEDMDAGSEASEWELRERQECREREEEREAVAVALGAEGEQGGAEPRCSYPPTGSWHRQTRGRGRCVISFVFSLATVLFFIGTGLGGGQRGACNEPLRADCGQENRIKMYTAMIYIGRMRV